MIKTAVKTENKAIEILQNWLNRELKEEFLSIDTYIDNVSCRCECGETQGLKAYYHHPDSKIATIAICESCGDDDNFEKEVLTVI